MSRTISLVYGYSARNAGDFAITLGAIDVLLELGCRVKLFSRYCKKNKDYWDAQKALSDRYGKRVSYYECPFNLDRSAKFLDTARNYLGGLLIVAGLERDSGFSEELLDADYVVFDGGNLFRCNSMIDLTRLLALTYPLRLARKKGKPIVIFPQSASRLNTLGRRVLFPVLRTAKQIYFREQQSYDYIHSFLKADNFSRSIDLAFFINKLGLRSSQREKKIAVTLRFHTVGDIAPLPETAAERIFQQMGTYVNVLRNEYECLVVVQTDKDEPRSREFAELHGLKLIKSNNPLELLEIYQSVSLLLGMRLHSIILALSVGTPCFGLFYKQWGLKNPGLMDDFNMPYQMMDELADKTTLSHLENIKFLLKNLSETSLRLNERVEAEHARFRAMVSEVLDSPV